MPFEARQARLADAAFVRYDRGQGHTAQLNVGDCAVYAPARLLGEPFGFVGIDLVRPDVQRC